MMLKSVFKTLLWLPLLAVSLCACNEEPEVSTGTILGVVSGSDGTPLQGVTVSLRQTGVGFSTGSDGSFKFSDLKPGNYTVAFSKAGYDADSRDVVVVAGRETRLDMHMRVTAQQAAFSVSPTSVDFGSTATQIPVLFTNHGNSAAAWTIDLGDNPWLSVSQTSGSIQPVKSQSVTFKVDRNFVAEQKSVVVNIHADGNILPLNVTCSPANSAPEMTVTPSNLDFGADLTALDISVRNTGNASLNWKAVTPLPEAISLSLMQGTVLPGGDCSVRVSLDRSMVSSGYNSSFALSDGTHSFTVNVAANSGSNPGGNPSAGDIVAKSGLYAYFSFNGDFTDISENKVTGFGSPEPEFGDGPVAGSKAAYFSRSDKSSFVVSEGLIDSKNMSLSFWAKDISEGHIFHVVSFNTSGSRDGVMMRFDFVDGHLKYIVERYKINYRYQESGNFTHKKINDGEWHHIALVSDWEKTKWSCVTVKLYIDGELMDTLTEEINHYTEGQSSDSHFESGTKFVMGGENVPNMKIANFRVYDARCLDKSDIKEIFRNKQ